MGEKDGKVVQRPAPAEINATAFSNGVRLTAREWLVVGIFTVLLMPRGSATAIRDRAHGETPEEPLTPEGETFVISNPVDEPSGPDPVDEPVP